MKQYVVVGYRRNTLIIIDEEDQYYALTKKDAARLYPKGTLVDEADMKYACRFHTLNGRRNNNGFNK